MRTSSLGIIAYAAAVALLGSVAVAQPLTLTADFDTCFMTGASTVRGQFAIEGLAIPEPGDVFVVTAQAVNADTGAPVAVVPAQIFNGAAAQSPTDPSVLIGTQAAEISRVAGFADFATTQGVHCAGGKINVQWRILTYTQNGAAVAINGAAPLPAQQAATASAAPTCNCPTAAPKTQPVTANAVTKTTAATVRKVTAAPKVTVAPAPKVTVAPAPKVTVAPAPKVTVAPAPTVAAPSNLVNADPVTVTYSGQCSGGGGAIQLLVQTSKGGAAFKPDAANPGGGVPCDEYFELSFAFVDMNGAVVRLAPPANAFFNSKRLTTDAAGNIVAQFTPEVNGFGSGFLQLGTSGLTCTNGVANFKIRTNYLLTALNDGTYNRMLNAVTDAGFFGSGKQTTVPANANALGLGQPQCNVKTGTFITFPFPAAA